jgi:hypothetical protein
MPGIRFDFLLWAKGDRQLWWHGWLPSAALIDHLRGRRVVNKRTLNKRTRALSLDSFDQTCYDSSYN